ncbi:MAG: hypothetical protein ACRDH0_01980 [Actinomycetota bacterium]
MKLIIGLIVGFLVGYQLGRMAAGTEASSDLATQGRKLAGGAARFGQTAVQRARTTIQSRLMGDGERWD